MADTLDMAALEREHREWLAEIRAANSDLEERLGALGITLDYDDERDILFCRFGPPTEALTESVDDLVYVRVDPDTLKIVGLEILHARTALAERPAVATFLLHAAAATAPDALLPLTSRLATDIEVLIAA